MGPTAVVLVLDEVTKVVLMALYLACNGEWFRKSHSVECVPSVFLLVCVSICNVYVSS